MQIQTNTDASIDGSEQLEEYIETVIDHHLGRFSDRITRIEVHLTDVNSHKPGDNDKHCVVEARLGGLQPIAVSHQGSTLQQAVEGAVKKMRHSLDRTLGKLRDH